MVLGKMPPGIFPRDFSCQWKGGGIDGRVVVGVLTSVWDFLTSHIKKIPFETLLTLCIMLHLSQVFLVCNQEIKTPKVI